MGKAEQRRRRRESHISWKADDDKYHEQSAVSRSMSVFSLFADLCTDLEYERLKAELLRYHCERIEESDCRDGIAGKDSQVQKHQLFPKFIEEVFVS